MKIKEKLRKNELVFFTHYVLCRCLYSYLKFDLNSLLIHFNIHSSGISKKKIKELHNSKSGSCVIIGNGPSVSEKDLDILCSRGIDAFGSNRISNIYSRTKWRPTYLSVMDTSFLTNVGAKISPKEYILQSDDDKLVYIFLNKTLKKYKLENKKIIYFNVPLSPTYSKRMNHFSRELDLYVADLGDVTKFNIQLAVYMGYSTIYLYGMDFGYKKYFDQTGKFVIENEVISHFSGMQDFQNDQSQYKKKYTKYSAIKEGGFSDNRKNINGYIECKQYANSNNIKIINITRGGRLEVFERQNFDDVFSKD